jgi:hypothetical protein
MRTTRSVQYEGTMPDFLGDENVRLAYLAV